MSPRFFAAAQESGGGCCILSIYKKLELKIVQWKERCAADKIQLILGRSAKMFPLVRLVCKTSRLLSVLASPSA